MVSLVRKQMTPAESQQLAAETRELGAEPARAPGLLPSVGLLLAGVALLTGGAHATVTGAADLGRAFGLTERVIGLTIVAAGTGLPEVVTSLVSSIRGRDDVAIGNVIGSNLFNVLGILGINALISPLPIAPEIAAWDTWWMLGVTALLFPLMYTGRRISRLEGGVLLAVYGAYTALLLTR
jgi:cation:H+ antiporter